MMAPAAAFRGLIIDLLFFSFSSSYRLFVGLGVLFPCTSSPYHEVCRDFMSTHLALDIYNAKANRIMGCLAQWVNLDWL